MAALSRALVALLTLSACHQPKPVDRSKAPPELVLAAASEPSLASTVARELARANAEHVQLLVYVGASWCEPCRYFHEALTAGQLANELPGVRFLELDYDAHHDALKGAGYLSRMIPLFALPNPDGTASERQIEGSIKGPHAVTQNLVPRLHTLLNKP